MSVIMPICCFDYRMKQLNQAAGQATEVAKALVCPLQRDVEQLKRDVDEIWDILKYPKRHVMRDMNEIRQPSKTNTSASIISYSSQCFTYAGMFCDCSSISKQILR